MLHTQGNTLWRRAGELKASSERENNHDEDSGALLLFYATECALKSVYMTRNALKTTDDSRGAVEPAFRFSHRIENLMLALNVPASSVGKMPKWSINSSAQTGCSGLHEGWRYGIKIKETTDICIWLNALYNWARRNR